MLKHISKTLKSATLNPHIHTRNKTLISNPAIDFILDNFQDFQSSSSSSSSTHLNNPTQLATKPTESNDPVSSSVQVSHQWPEWIELMEKLMKFGYFDGVKYPFRSGELIDGKSCNQIRTACLNFARDRPGLMSCFMVEDIETIAGSGCPSIDRKVVNSGKRLRAHLGIDEGNVCNSCNLRGNCERAYVKVREDEGGHTVDVMRFILTYGLDYNKPFINKRLEEAVRSLTKHMVKFSKNKLHIDPSTRVSSVKRRPTQQQEHQSVIPTISGSWNCSKCKFLNSARNIKCMRCNDTLDESLPRSRNNWDHVQLKGDWLCIRCNFFNFAKNTRCLQCHTNPPKRQLNPGEWECDSCNYINFRRNTVCLKCDYKRAKAFNDSTRLQ
ncbi:hypothetical protein QVD17_35494 [Tagetes erecta]|uniref:RanBP2-type domain-containing protein n=1 Tax=Tagetes erecta TaxID=13708 RepID=A0AAD8NMF3_TARER|nr:hypothetical protein QVD17_35494 [Tagetes erecta]